MIHQLSPISAETISPWPPVLIPDEAWQPRKAIRDSGLGLWRGVAIGLPISAAIWVVIVAMLAELL